MGGLGGEGGREGEEGRSVVQVVVEGGNMYWSICLIIA